MLILYLKQFELLSENKFLYKRSVFFSQRSWLRGQRCLPEFIAESSDTVVYFMQVHVEFDGEQCRQQVDFHLCIHKIDKRC